jgi:glucokinase
MMQSTSDKSSPTISAVPETAVAIGLDIGGTKISAARVSLKEGMTEFNKVHTPEHGQAFVAAIESLVKPLKANSPEPPQCLGIASAGTINSETGEIFGSTGNLPALREVGFLRQTLEDRLQMPVYIENDANAAAYGEARLGAAKGCSEVLMITLGTGIGSGILIHNQLVRGAHYSAAEGGHICISMNKDRLCTCGKWDCWEAYASGTGLAETARLALRAAPNAESSQILSLSDKQVEEVTTHDLIAALRAGDFIAKEVMDLWHYHIATGLGSLLNVLDPEIVVVGGGMAEFVDFERLLFLTKERSMYKNIRLMPAQLGNQAGIMGAALLALERVYQ